MDKEQKIKIITDWQNSIFEIQGIERNYEKEFVYERVKISKKNIIRFILGLS